MNITTYSKIIYNLFKKVKNTERWNDSISQYSVLTYLIPSAESRTCTDENTLICLDLSKPNSLLSISYE